MKVLLASLALLPLIASHVYLQLPPLSVNSRSLGHPIPLGLRQYSQQDPDSSLKDPQSNAKDNHKATHSSSSQNQQHNLYDSASSSSSDQDFSNDWRHLYPGAVDANLLESLSAAKRSSEDYEFAAQGKLSGDAPLPSGDILPASLLQQHLYLRPLLTYARLARNLSHRFYNAPSSSSSNQLQVEGFPLDGVKRPQAKRYLGIELPDYIASSDKSSMKLHDLKQRMRSVGK